MFFRTFSCDDDSSLRDREKHCTDVSPFSNGSGEQQGKNAVDQSIDSAPNVLEREKMVPLSLEMVGSQSVNT